MIGVKSTSLLLSPAVFHPWTAELEPSWFRPESGRVTVNLRSLKTFGPQGPVVSLPDSGSQSQDGLRASGQGWQNAQPQSQDGLSLWRPWMDISRKGPRVRSKPPSYRTTIHDALSMRSKALVNQYVIMN